MLKKGILITSLATVSIFVWLLVDVPLSEGAKRWLQVEHKSFAGESFAELTSRMEEYPRNKNEPRQLRTLCDSLKISCLEAIRQDPASFPHLTGDQEFWDLYEQTQQNQFEITRITDALDMSAHTWIEAIRDVMLRDVAVHGQLQANTVSANVNAARRWNLEAETLLERMFSITALGIANRGLSLHLLNSDPENWPMDTERLLRAMNAEELSYERTVRGELRYMQLYLEEEVEFWDRLQQGKPNHVINMAYERHAAVIDHTNKAKQKFWLTAPFKGQPMLNMWDWVVDPIGSMGAHISIEFPHYQYMQGIHYVDIQLALLRALAGMRAGNIAFSKPITAPPTGWEWVWYEETPDLCLAPENVHSKVKPFVEEVCFGLPEFVSEKTVI